MRNTLPPRQRWLDQGRSLDDLSSLMKTIDPCTYLHANQTPTDCSRQVLMLNAANDEVIPRVCTDQLWRAFGRPPIVWYNCGHYSAIFHIVDALDRTAAFFGADSKPGAGQ